MVCQAESVQKHAEEVLRQKLIPFFFDLKRKTHVGGECHRPVENEKVLCSCRRAGQSHFDSVEINH